jgi:D-alanyl-D-alanine carboxypeptidase
MRGAFVSACLTILWLLAPAAAVAAPYAALVMDARNGQIIYSENADTRLHPASLTKMMTLYITFDAIRRGEVTLDTPITVSANAANQAPSRLGLRAGQVIPLRYLIRGAAVKSANDAAAAIGDALSGNEAAFAVRMNATAKALGMTNSTFHNANGLTRPGHLSSAHDMAILGRHLFYDFPEYYNIFSRRETDAGLATVYSTNRKFLEAYDGADGIKTGYTGPSGFNLVASAQRGNKRLIGVIFGETSTAARNQKMAELLDMGFSKVAENVPVRKPALPDLTGIAPGTAAPAPAAAVDLVAQVDGDANGRPSTGKTLRLNTAVASSPLPRARPDAGAQEANGTAGDSTEVAAADTPAVPPPPRPDGLDLASTPPAPRPETLPQPSAIAAADPETPPSATVGTTQRENASVADNDGEAVDPPPPGPTRMANIQATSAAIEATAAEAPPPKPRSDIVFASVAPTGPVNAEPAPEVISRLSTSGAHDWAITLGRFNSRDAAEKVLLRTALSEPTTLDQTLRKVIDRKNGFDANFVGLSQGQADLACRRIQARGQQCFTMAP